ncbi:MAG: cysteine desulfurase [Fimbriimonas sp.]|nr:cysteine desulfurase [Fimbriimonas sp.]
MNTATLTKLDVTQVRADFPILETVVNGRPLVYLDNGATSQKPLSVIRSQDDYYRSSNANVHRGVHHLSQIATRQFDLAREKVRVLLNARHAHEVIFTAGCTASINLVVQAWGRLNVKAGDEILVSTMEHHSNIVSWQLLAEQVGATVRPIPITDEGEIELDTYRSMLSERTKVVGIVHVSNSLGTVNPVKQMIEWAHAVGAVVLVDGAQAAPHMRIDVQAVDADFYTLSCHKMFAPTGIGVLYGKESLLDEMPPYQGGGDMINTVSFNGTTYAKLPFKFEAGTPNIAGVIGLGAAVDYLASIGQQLSKGDTATMAENLDAAFAWIEHHEAGLTKYGMKALADIPGVRLTGTSPHKAGILAFTLDVVHPHDIGTVLDSQGIAIRAGHHCCMPLMTRLGVPATARASLALYNTREEIDRLVSAVEIVREMFT